jgi:16S rRNA (cytosine967-C5)-methyltransferase
MACLQVLNTLDRGSMTLDHVLEEMYNGGLNLTRKDHGLFNALTYGVLRWRSRLDWVIRHYSKTPIDRIEPAVQNILRMALFQIIFLDKVPESAAVNTAVDMTKSTAGSWVVKYVNGVLRNAVRGYRELPYPDMASNPVEAMAVEYAFPRWIARRWVDRYGVEDAARICQAVNVIPPVTLRANTLKTSREDLARALSDHVRNVGTTPYAPDGLTVSGLGTAISDMPAYQEGLFQVQDEAAQLVGLFLDPQPGEAVLDACAGLGGKTGHMAQMMQNHGRIVALDSSRKKLQRLEAEMKRLGVATVTTCAADLDAVPADLPSGSFDRILLDAPCSGLGVLRRNPDAKWRSGKKQLAAYGRRQTGFLNNLAGLVKPSGVIVFAVCSTEPEENESVAKDFLNNHPEFVMENRISQLHGARAEILEPNGFLKTCPHRHQTDGFFAARFRRMR